MAQPTNNPVNQQSRLFKALTRLFSGPIINYRSQTGRRIRRQHLDEMKDMWILIRWSTCQRLHLAWISMPTK